MKLSQVVFINYVFSFFEKVARGKESNPHLSVKKQPLYERRKRGCAPPSNLYLKLPSHQKIFLKELLFRAEVRN